MLPLAGLLGLLGLLMLLLLLFGLRLLLGPLITRLGLPLGLWMRLPLGMRLKTPELLSAVDKRNIWWSY